MNAKPVLLAVILCSVTAKAQSSVAERYPFDARLGNVLRCSNVGRGELPERFSFHLIPNASTESHSLVRMKDARNSYDTYPRASFDGVAGSGIPGSFIRTNSRSTNGRLNRVRYIRLKTSEGFAALTLEWYDDTGRRFVLGDIHFQFDNKLELKFPFHCEIDSLS